MARQQKQECGCVAKDGRWVTMCPPCKKEFDETSARWQADLAKGWTREEREANRKKLEGVDDGADLV